MLPPPKNSKIATISSALRSNVGINLIARDTSDDGD